MSDNPLSSKIIFDTTDFKAGMAELNRQIRVMESGFKATAAGMEDWENNSAGLEARIKSLGEVISLQKQKVAGLQGVYNKLAAEGKTSGKEMQELQIKINKETETLGKMRKELSKSEEALDGMGKESKDAGVAIDKLGNESKEAGDKMGKMGNVASGLKGALKAGTVAIAGLSLAVAGAAVAMGKKVVESFGQLEQNLGGSEAVFGEYAAHIQKVGEDAYKSLGVSQSDYLATANKMGALFQGSGLDQVKSLELTGKAMQRAADMASVMGIDMQVALDSVAGAAKGNFTMMDNLGVAMNATNVEAYALSKGLDFAWASATNAEKAEVAMQMFFESTEQYAGNFEKESSETISGSIGMFKAAFGSFMAGLGNEDADVGNLTKNLVNAFESVLSNIVPVLENIVAVLPTATSAILAAIGDMLPMLVETATTLFTQILTTVVGLLPSLIPVAVNGIMTIVGALIDSLPLLMAAGNQLLFALIDGILPLLPMLLTAAIQIVVQLANGIMAALPTLIPTVVSILMQLVLTLIENLPMLINAAMQLILALSQGLIAALPILMEMLPTIMIQLVEGLLMNLGPLLLAAVEIILTLGLGIIENIPKLLAMMPKVISALVDKFKSPEFKAQMKTMGAELVNGLKEGWTNAWNNFKNNIVENFKGMVEIIKKLLGIASPSKVFDGMGAFSAEGYGDGFLRVFDDVQREINRMINGMGDMNITGGLIPVLTGAGNYRPQQAYGQAAGSGQVNSSSESFQFFAPVILQGPAGTSMGQMIKSKRY